MLALAALALILLLARAGGEVARRIGQPEVLGELLAGFLLGPSVFGAVLPGVYRTVLLNQDVGLVLSGFSWVGATLLLLMAGLEVDIAVLRRQTRAGALAAVLAIVPSLVAGTLFAWLVFGVAIRSGVFLGIVLTVTGVSVVSKILLERGTTRREYAQVILAAGIASEVVVWLFVSVASSLHGASPWLAGLRSAAFAVLFFLVIVTLGRRLVFWAMRRVQDSTGILNGQLTLVLVLTFGAAAVTQGLGLHALLGAFTIGVLLSQAPRTNETLRNQMAGATAGIFGPIFFALAGMRVDLFRLGSLAAVGEIALLLAVATLVKVGFSALGARLGGRTAGESLLIGVGLNLKGGTDVVVAVIGSELGLLSVAGYTMYGVVAMLTVLFSPPLIALLERRTPPGEEEQERLEREEATRRSYVPRIERVLVPMDERLHPNLAAAVVKGIATSKDQQAQLFDITELEPRRAEIERLPVSARARERLGEVETLKDVQVTQEQARGDEVLQGILTASAGYDLVAIGASFPPPHQELSLGELQDAIIHRAEADVLVVVDDDAHHFDPCQVNRILVPISGLEYSLAGGDIAGALADDTGATIVLLTVVHSDVDEEVWRDRDREVLVRNAQSTMDELAFRLGRLGVPVEKRVCEGTSAGDVILEELQRGGYDLVVLGGADRGKDDRPYLGRAIRTVLLKDRTPAVLLVTRAT